jgi:hypothetical protein
MGEQILQNQILRNPAAEPPPVQHPSIPVSHPSRTTHYQANYRKKGPLEPAAYPVASVEESVEV